MKLFLQRKEKPSQLHGEQAERDVPVWEAEPNPAEQAAPAPRGSHRDWAGPITVRLRVTPANNLSLVLWAGRGSGLGAFLPRVCRDQLPAGLTGDGEAETVEIWEENAGRAGWLKPATLGFPAGAEGEKGTGRRSLAKVQSNVAECWARSFIPAQAQFPFRWPLQRWHRNIKW